MAGLRDATRFFKEAKTNRVLSTFFDRLDLALGDGFVHPRPAVAGIGAADTHGDVCRFMERFGPVIC